MLFNSVIFITIFLPFVLTGWYLLQRLENPAYGKVFLIGCSLFFYGYYNVSYLWILVVSLLWNYCVSEGFALLGKTPSEMGAQTPQASGGRSLRNRRFLLILGLSGNLGLLFYFKYFNFFIENCNWLLHTQIQIEEIALPLGISFFTFQQISFLVERYRGKAPRYAFLDYGCFITFFPQLVAGPIVLHDEFIPQLQGRLVRRPRADLFYRGVSLFILGLAKKVLLADVLGILVNAEFDNIAYLDCPSAWLTIVCYMLELYFDFSGYSDMARGLGRLFGFELPENFRSPLMAVSVKDFWRRWHLTLSRFLSAYIYIPLGGNRKGKGRQCLNLFLVFLASGIWHGADWTFIVWGLMHGLACIWETLFPRLRFKKDWANRIVTGLFVTLSFSIFRSDSLESAFLLWRKLFAGGMNGMLLGMCNVLQIPETYALRKLLEWKFPQALNAFFVICTALLLGISIRLVSGKRAEEWLEKKGQKPVGILLLATLFVWSLVSLSQVSTFLYFNF